MNPDREPIDESQSQSDPAEHPEDCSRAGLDASTESGDRDATALPVVNDVREPAPEAMPAHGGTGLSTSTDDSAAEQARPVPPARHRRVGIGIPEAVLWTLGMLAVHLVGGIVAMVWIVARQVMNAAAPGDPEAVRAALVRLMTDRQALQSLVHDNLLSLLIGEMGIFVVCAVGFSLLRVGWSPQRKLGLRMIPAKQLLLILGMTVPLSLVCGTLHQWSTAGWDAIADHVPVLRSLFEGADVNEQLKPLSEGAPLGLLILAIALAPAVGEEIVFRGVIGRGLVARHGTVAGVILTSLLFASVHLHPAHVVALLPLAIAIHFVYLVTKSFWAPVLLHFSNNALAAVLLKVSARVEGNPLAADQELPIWSFVIACVLVGLAVRVLWTSRTEYRLPGGEVWSPGYETVEVPPASLCAVPVQSGGSPAFCLFTLASSFLFTALFAASLAFALQQAVLLSP